MIIEILIIILIIWVICITLMIRAINHVLSNHLQLIYILRDDIIQLREDKK